MKEHNPIEGYGLEDDNFYIKTEQTLGEDFWKNLEHDKEEFDIRANGLVKAATLPTAIVNRWAREGFNIYTDPTITAQQIIDRLNKEDFSKFIISGSKRF